MLNSAKKDIIRKEKEFIQDLNSAKFSTSFTSRGGGGDGPQKRDNKENTKTALTDKAIS